MTADVTTLIRAKVEARRRVIADPTPGPWHITDAEDLRFCDHADKVLARHMGFGVFVERCGWCAKRWPCPDIDDLVAAWGVEP